MLNEIKHPTGKEIQELLASSRSPWHFLTTHVKTQDPQHGTRAYPDYPFLHTLVTDALAQRYLLVPKSRQMLVTWSMVALFLWRALLHKPGDYLFLSRNERCAEELLDRARFILDHLPRHMQPKLSANNKSELAFAGLHSRLLSLPATPDGPRMYSPTAVLWDEMAFTPFDSQIWTALQPAIESGGSFVGVSSSGGAHNLFAKLAGAGVDAPRPFHIHRIHYSLHPERDAAWRVRASRGLSQRQWEREQEISFAQTDDLVYSEFDPAVHILKEEFHPRREWELYRAIDFGFRRPFVLWLQRLPAGEFVVFNEWDGKDATTDAMLSALRAIDLTFGLSESDFRWTACDPSGAGAQDSGLSPVDSLARRGMKLRYRSSRILPCIERVKSSLRDATGKISLFISPRCRKLLLDLHRYRWNAARDEPLKDGDSDHSLDALRYFFVNLEAVEDYAPAAPRLAEW